MGVIRDNHYVPRTYLKRWEGPGRRVWVYRTLVPHASVHVWKARSVKGIAYHEHLYTQTAHGAECDTVEKWLADHVDGPSEPALAKVANEENLTPKDWNTLLRFFAASYSRTPAYYFRRRPIWDRDLPAVIEGSLKKTIDAALSGTASKPQAPQEGPHTERFEIPAGFRLRENPSGKGGLIEARVLMGRGLWFFEMKRIVEHTWKGLRPLHWTILRPPDGKLWLTSDDPAVVAHISAQGDVTFDGRWNVPGTVLLLPLSPEHVLYGRPEKPLPHKYTEASAADAEFIRNCLVHHAHRMIFAREQDDWVPTVRQRTEDARKYEHEQSELSKWHTSHTKGETDLEDESTWPTPDSGPQ
jgi:hypothetical protein